MTDREKLIALLKGNLPYHSNDVAYWQDERIGALADHLIANGMVVHRWIPVTERLPELGKNVLMYFKDGETVVSGFLNGGEPGRATWWSSFTDGDWYTDCDSSPDYWKPLPALPMRKGENG